MNRIRHHLARLLRSAAGTIDRAALVIEVSVPVIADPIPTVAEHLQARLESEEQRQAAIAAKIAWFREQLVAQTATLERLEAARLEQVAAAERKAREIVTTDHPWIAQFEKLSDEQRARWMEGAS